MGDSDCLDLYRDAEFYDAEFSAREFEIPFYRRWAARCGDPILEVACGTGRLTIPIAEDGRAIVGLDVSGPMLSLAARKSAERGLAVEWVHQDCREMRLDRKFSLIFAATNAMQHLLDRESAEAFLRSAAAHVRPDGFLVLDVFNPDVRRLARGPQERYVQKTFADAAGNRIEVEASSRYLAETQILHFDLTYRRGTEVVRTKSVDMRCFFPEELLALCHHNGWRVTDRFGDYDETPFTSASPKQLLVCRLANPESA